MTSKPPKYSKFDRVELNPGLTVVYPPDQDGKPSSEEIKVDIIAVPGLGANPVWTWKSKNQVDWLRDTNMLPQRISNARIMVFEYRSQWLGRSASNQKISYVADQLLMCLFHRRSRGSKKPILFVSHCLGGLIVEKTLLNARSQQSEYPNVFRSVVGCVFLGTPFRGTKSQHKALLVAGIMEKYGLGIPSDLIKLLDEDSEILEDLLSQFSMLARETYMRIVCFFEQRPSNLMDLIHKGPHPKFEEVIVKQKSAHIDSHPAFELDADHFHLNKFTGPKDGNFLAVADEIKATVQKAEGILRTREKTDTQNLIDDATFQSIMDGLKTTDPQKDLSDSVKERSTNQESWALNNDKYKEWCNAYRSKVLWIHGNADKGQSVIAASIIKNLEQQTKREDEAFLAFFFCDEKDSHRRDMRDVLKLLIRQMIWKNRDLTEHLLIEKGRGKKSGHEDFNKASLSSLWRSLQVLLSDPSVEKVYFIINAFDQTDKDSRKEFLPLLEDCLGPASINSSEDETRVKWLFLSRSGRPDIERCLTRALVVCMEDKENASGVNSEAKRTITELIDKFAREKDLSHALTYMVKRYVHTKADEKYIYAEIVVQELRNLDPSHSNIPTIRKFLEDLPYGLTDMLQFISHRVLDPNREGIAYTKEILRCMLLTMQSPTTYELALIAGLPEKVYNDDEALIKHVKRCGAFLKIIIDENAYDRVAWVGGEAKEHLMTYAMEDLSLGLNDIQHGLIALRCFDYVRLGYLTDDIPADDSETNIEASNTETAVIMDSDGEDDNANSTTYAKSESDDASRHNQEIETSSVKSKNDEKLDQSDNFRDYPSFNLYPVNFWLEHAMEAAIDVLEEFDMSDDFWSEVSPVREAWWNKYRENRGLSSISGLTPLHLAAYSGYTALVDHLLAHGHEGELNKLDSSGFTPLVWACEKGDERTVYRLVKAGADVKPTADTGGCSPLWAAATFNHTELVSYLLEHGAEVNYQSEMGSPLYAAASDGDVEIVQELLRHGANVNLKGGRHMRPVNAAAYSGHKTVLEVLLPHSTIVESDEEYSYGNALGAAARSGQAEIVRLLLRQGWNANPKMTTYGSPFVAAATFGHADVVKVLVEHGVGDSSQVQQALDIASKRGKLDVVQLLSNSPFTISHEKAFHEAAYHGHNEILELLKLREITVEMLNKALYDASDQEKGSTVGLLLKWGADPNAEGDIYGNALQAAAWDGTTEIVESLLAYSADVNKRGGDYGTALQAAAACGHTNIVQILLDHGAQVNTEIIGLYGSALQAACCLESSDVVELLLNYGADVNAPGGLYGSPIMAAVEEGANTILEILVKNKADVHARNDGEKRAPLLVRAGYILVTDQIEMLIDHDADIEAADDEGTTVLISTADCGDQESLKMLLRRGANISAVSRELGTALRAAAFNGDVESVRVLLDHGADVNQDCGLGGTALQAAATEDTECVNMLLEAGADVNSEGGTYGSALHASAWSGKDDCVRRLLEAGARVDVIDDRWGSALTRAAGAGHLGCVNILLKHGANVNLRGGKNECALQSACQKHDNKECVKALLAQGADTCLDGGCYGSVIQAAAFGRNLDLWDLLVEHGAQVGAKGGKYGHALQAAALKGDRDFVLRLLEHGAEVNHTLGKYHTALQAAAASGEDGVVNLLLTYHANVQLEGGFYGNALNAAVCRGSTEVLETLLKQTLPSDMVNGSLLRAVSLRQDEAVRKLLEHGASIKATKLEHRSPLDLLEIDSESDANSDFESEDDSDSEASSEDDESESQASSEDDDSESQASSEDGDEDEEDAGASPTDDGASIASLQLESPKTAHQKIKRYLEEAIKRDAVLRRDPTLRRQPTFRRKATLKRNSALHRSYAVQRKPVAASRATDRITEVLALYDESTAPEPQQLKPVGNAYQPFRNQWQSPSHPPALYPAQASLHMQTAPSSRATNRNVLYRDHPSADWAHETYQNQPATVVTSSSNETGRPSIAQRASDQGEPLRSRPAQSSVPSLPKASSYSGSVQTSGSLVPSKSQPNLSARSIPHAPPPTPPRTQPTNSEYQPYRRNTEQPPYRAQEPYQSQQRHPSQPNPSLPYLSEPLPSRAHQAHPYPPSQSQTPPRAPDYASTSSQYPPPSSQYPPPPSQYPPDPRSSPPFHPSLAQNQDADPTYFDPSLDKAQKWKFWK